MNSVLQALAHTPPLAELFLSARNGASPSGSAGPSTSGSQGAPADIIAIMAQHVQRVFRMQMVAPKGHASHLKTINKR